MTSKFSFNPFNERSLTPTRTAWSADCDKGLGIRSSVDRLFDWIDKKHDGDDRAVYGLFPESKHIADGVCEVVVTKEHRKWIKMIDVKLRPSLDAKVFIERDFGALGQAIRLYADSVLGVFQISRLLRLDTVKLYGRSSEQLLFLQGLKAELRPLERSGISAVIEGRWLVIRKGKQ